MAATVTSHSTRSVPHVAGGGLARRLLHVARDSVRRSVIAASGACVVVAAVRACLLSVVAVRITKAAAAVAGNVPRLVVVVTHRRARHVVDEARYLWCGGGINNTRLGGGTHHMSRRVVAGSLATSCEIDDLGSRVGGDGEEEKGG